MSFTGPQLFTHKCNVARRKQFWMILTKKISPVGTDGRLPLSDLDLGSGHTAYHRASLIDLYLYTKFHSDRKKKIFEGHN